MALFTLEWNGDDFFKTAQRIHKAAMIEAANLVSAYAKNHMTLQGSHKPSKRGTKIHFSAAPGEPPAIDTGVLRASLVAEVKEVRFGVIGKVGPDIGIIKAKSEPNTDVEYGLYQELGTRKMAARPFLRPALRANITKIQRIFRKANK